MGKLSRGNRNIKWIEDHCRIPEGKFVGQPVRLCAFQKKIIKGIYDDPTRKVIVSFGRKNAKTTLAAFLCLLHLCGPEAKANSQLYSAAQSREQAAILFSLMAKIVRMSSELSDFVGVRDSVKQLYCDELGTLYRALSAEASTAYGLSPVFVVHDELGQVKGPRSELYDALETACAAQEEPLSVIISTQAPTDADLLSVLIDDAKAGHDSETKLFLYTAPEDIDPFSVAAIKAANPAYNFFMNKKEVKKQADNASRMPTSESAYRNLVLNQRVSAESPFVTPSIWKRNGAKPLLDDFNHRVVLALDLSKRTDLTAIAIIGANPAGGYGVRCEFFAPEDGLADRAKRDRVPYDLWAQKGYITTTPGNTVKFENVAQRLIELCEELPVESIQFDRWKIEELKAHLKYLGAEDLPLIEHGQGFKDMSPAIDKTEQELLDGSLRHGNNPVLTWCASNAVAVIDPAELRKLDKKKSTGRIDGMVATVMGVGAAVMPAAEPKKLSKYETEELLTG